jgi:hypothetical protein
VAGEIYLWQTIFIFFFVELNAYLLSKCHKLNIKI